MVDDDQRIVNKWKSSKKLYTSIKTFGQYNISEKLVHSNLIYPMALVPKKLKQMPDGALDVLRRFERIVWWNKPGAEQALDWLKRIDSRGAIFIDVKTCIEEKNCNSIITVLVPSSWAKAIDESKMENSAKIFRTIRKKDREGYDQENKYGVNFYRKNNVAPQLAESMIEKLEPRMKEELIRDIRENAVEFLFVDPIKGRDFNDSNGLLKGFLDFLKNNNLQRNDVEKAKDTKFVTNVLGMEIKTERPKPVSFSQVQPQQPRRRAKVQPPQQPRRRAKVQPPQPIQQQFQQQWAQEGKRMQMMPRRMDNEDDDDDDGYTYDQKRSRYPVCGPGRNRKCPSNKTLREKCSKKNYDVSIMTRSQLLRGCGPSSTTLHHTQKQIFR